VRAELEGFGHALDNPIAGYLHYILREFLRTQPGVSFQVVRKPAPSLGARLSGCGCRSNSVSTKVKSIPGVR